MKKTAKYITRTISAWATQFTMNQNKRQKGYLVDRKLKKNPAKLNRLRPTNAGSTRSNRRIRKRRMRRTTRTRPLSETASGAPGTSI